MPSTKINSWLERTAWRFGYQVRKVPARRRQNRGFDAFEDQELLLRAESPQTIFDLGANAGLVTQRYHKLFPSAVIHAFEPLPETYRALCKSTEGTSQVHAHNLAVADRSGMRTFFLNRAHVTNSLLPVASAYNQHYANSDATVPIGEVEVPTTTLDEFCQQHCIDRIHLLKLLVPEILRRFVPENLRFLVVRSADDVRADRGDTVGGRGDDAARTGLAIRGDDPLAEAA